MSKTAVILGGGISGLSAAYYLSKHASNKFGKILVLEGSNRLGGWIKTTRFGDGTIFEHGPRSMRTAGIKAVNSLELVEELGLGNQVLPCLVTSSAARHRYIYVHNQMYALPSGLKGAIKTQPPFTKPLAWYGIREFFKRKSDLTDETVDSFMGRRFGTEVAKYLMDPVCRGIYAGNSRELSMLACFPEVFKMEKKYGSLLKGGFKMAREMKHRPKPKSELVKKAKAERWSTWQLKNGLQQLTETLAVSVKNTEIQTNRKCVGLESLPGNKMKVKTKDGDIVADHVISSVYAKDLARLLPTHETLTKHLQSIPAANVVVVNLEFEGKHLPHDGFGHLLPSFENGPFLGVIYDSCSFPQHNKGGGGDTTRLTVILGGAWFQDLLELNPKLDEGIFLEMTLKQLKQQLGVSGTPSKTKVSINKECIPHYLVGHSAKVEAMFKYIEEQNIPLTLIGSSYLGAAVNDCIYNAKQAVLKLA